MVSYLQVQNLTRRVGDRTLFQDLSFSIGERQKVGLIAQNGTGKSTLLNILSGKDVADEGNVIYHNDLQCFAQIIMRQQRLQTSVDIRFGVICHYDYR